MTRDLSLSETAGSPSLHRLVGRLFGLRREIDKLTSSSPNQEHRQQNLPPVFKSAVDASDLQPVI
jgi:hypothetical protein